MSPATAGDIKVFFIWL